MEDSSHRVRRIRPDGIVETVAGTGQPGFSGDGGPAPLAQLFFPTALAVDSAGVLYIADSSNHRIRKVTLDGTIQTIAGGGSRDPAEGGPATTVRLLYPKGIAVDRAGAVYFSEEEQTSSRRWIRRIDPTAAVTTLYESARATQEPGHLEKLSDSRILPDSLVLDAQGNLYIGSSASIWKLLPEQRLGYVAGYSRRLPAGHFALAFPTGLNAANDGSILLEPLRSRYRGLGPGVFRLSVDGLIEMAPAEQTLPLAPGQPVRPFWLKSWDSVGQPVAVAPDPSGALLVAYRLQWPYSSTVTTADSLPQGWKRPTALAADRQGNVYVADCLQHRIQKLTPGHIVETVAGTGKPGFRSDGCSVLGGAAANAAATSSRGVTTRFH